LSGKCPVPLDRREKMGLKSLCMESHAPLSRERGEVKVVSRGKSCVPQGDEAKVHLEVVYP